MPDYPWKRHDFRTIITNYALVRARGSPIMRSIVFRLILTAFLLVAAAASSEATPVFCPGSPAPGDREFMVNTTPDSICSLWGTGNINGNPAQDPIIAAGWSLIDKDDVNNEDPLLFSYTGDETLGGTFTINPILWSTWGRLLIGFKSGEGQIDPDWAGFELPFLLGAGPWNWGIVTGTQTLSHAILYGRGTPTVLATPEPATLLLLGTGLSAAALRLRRRRRS